MTKEQYQNVRLALAHVQQAKELLAIVDRDIVLPRALIKFGVERFELGDLLRCVEAELKTVPEPGKGAVNASS